MDIVDDGGSDTVAQDESLFYFESDHLALRGNADYSNMLRTIAVLEAQRSRVLKQIEELNVTKNRFLEDHDLLLQKLKKNEEIISPTSYAVAELPQLRHYNTMPAEEIPVKKEPEEPESLAPVVRGRVADQTKSETFNRLWTCEEQRRLEQLLIEYPVEPIESRRFAKIAKALGNRTPQQVSSRVQKYFQKLHNAGLPIPGRIPKNRRNQAKARHAYRPTTFFPAHHVPVQMPDDDLFVGDLQRMHSRPTNFYDKPTHTTLPPVVSASSRNSASLRGFDEESDDRKPVFDDPTDTRQQIIYMLEIIRKEKADNIEGYYPDPMAPKCEACHVVPIARTRWHCYTCFCYLSLCLDCLAGKLIDNTFDHLTHKVKAESDN